MISAPPKTNIPLLNKILYGIREGRLPYDPTTVHHGNTHCLAGWTIVEYMASRGYKWNPKKEAFVNKEGKEDEVYNEVSFAKKYLGLTDREAAIMFNSRTDLDTQLKLTRLLEKDIRLFSEDVYLPECNKSHGQLFYYIRKGRRHDFPEGLNFKDQIDLLYSSIQH